MRTESTWQQPDTRWGWRDEGDRDTLWGVQSQWGWFWFRCSTHWLSVQALTVLTRRNSTSFQLALLWLLVSSSSSSKTTSHCPLGMFYEGTRTFLNFLKFFSGPWSPLTLGAFLEAGPLTTRDLNSVSNTFLRGISPSPWGLSLFLSGVSGWIRDKKRKIICHGGI